MSLSYQVPISIDDLLQATKIGSLDKAVGNNLYGFNHEQIPSAVPYNRERHGFLFFVRPQLNLQLDNIRNDRKFMALAADKGYGANKDGNTSIHRFVRTTLDPRLITGYKYRTSQGTNGVGQDIPAIQSTLTNNKMGFIPVLTNNITSASGFPDPIVPIWTSKPGRYNESISMVDGLVQNFESYSVDVTFRNTVADPILYMFYIWSLYMQNVFMGKFVPYPDFLVDQRIDYNTRLFRVRLDRNRYKVTKIMSTGPAIPVASSVGQFGDLNTDEVFSSSNKDISMRFQCTGFEIFDDILVYEFNQVVSTFNSDMKASNLFLTNSGNSQQVPNPNSKMVLLPRSISYQFQHRAYPRIDPETHVMQWWVDKALFDSRAAAFIDNLALADTEQNTINDDDVNSPTVGKV